MTLETENMNKNTAILPLRNKVAQVYGTYMPGRKNNKEHNTLNPCMLN